MAKKLFKKLTEQIEINKTVKTPLTESEKNELEKKIIFGKLINNLEADKLDE